VQHAKRVGGFGCQSKLVGQQPCLQMYCKFPAKCKRVTPDFTELPIVPRSGSYGHTHIHIEVNQGPLRMMIDWPVSAALTAELWLAIEPVDMRSGYDTTMAMVIVVFGAAKPHHAYLFPNRRGNRIKVPRSMGSIRTPIRKMFCSGYPCSPVTEWKNCCRIAGGRPNTSNTDSVIKMTSPDAYHLVS
jgi:IS66 Orf2 like protein